jgi:hypothetical protein
MNHISDYDLERHHLGTIVDEAELAPLEEHLLACPVCVGRAEEAAVYTAVAVTAPSPEVKATPEESLEQSYQTLDSPFYRFEKHCRFQILDGPSDAVGKDRLQVTGETFRQLLVRQAEFGGNALPELGQRMLLPISCKPQNRKH